MKVCVIDDNNDILELLKNILIATGNEVSTADNGREGLSLVLSKKFDLVILDITMPNFSGIDVVRYLDSNGMLRSNHIIFLTAAYVSNSLLKEWYDKGVKTCLRKPVEFEDLFEYINEARIA